jgi:hypothetical protein
MLERPRVVLLGCFHQAQPLVAPSSYWNPHRAALATFVETLVESFGTQFIGEEADQEIISNAAVIGSRHQIPYENIDIPLSAQKQIKLHPRFGIDAATANYQKFEGSNRYVMAWDTVREYHMFEAFREACGSKTPSLLICGIAHQQGLTQLLSPAFEVILRTFDLDSEGVLQSS